MSSVSQEMSPFSLWLWALRPRTLPLAVSGIALGFGLAALFGHRHWSVFALALLTALLLQILSNLANDYGDFVAGADTGERVGPLRVVGSGLTSPAAMFRAVVLAASLALVSGLGLVLWASWGDGARMAFFLLLGVACVAAAIAYTVGKRPYGYLGLGDLMVLIFFGPVAVCGSAVLCGAPLSGLLFLPGLAAGLCSTAVLNINNMRDAETDRKAGKATVAVRLGRNRAQVYHMGLVLGALLLWALFWLLIRPSFLPLLLLFLPLGRSARMAVTRVEDAENLNLQLKKTVLSTALLNTGMGLACLLAG